MPISKGANESGQQLFKGLCVGFDDVCLVNIVTRALGV